MAAVSQRLRLWLEPHCQIHGASQSLVVDKVALRIALQSFGGNVGRLPTTGRLLSVGNPPNQYEVNAVFAVLGSLGISVKEHVWKQLKKRCQRAAGT